MAQIEVGVQGRQVVLRITVPGPGGVAADVVTVPLTADEAREIVNGLGEAVKFVAGSRA